jgi:amidase
VKTWSVGADGVDAKGERRSQGGNPQTGPFYVEGAMPGDTLVVRLNRIRTNRAWAVSGSRVIPAAVEPGHFATRTCDPRLRSPMFYPTELRTKA